MKQEDLKKSLDRIEPGDKVKESMLNNILKAREDKEYEEIKTFGKDNKYNEDRKQKHDRIGVFFMRKYRLAISVLALAVVVTGSVVAYDFNKNRYNKGNDAERNTEEWSTGDSASDDFIGRMPEDAVAIIKNQFQLEDKHYTILSEDMMVEYSFSETISEEHIGEMITTISTTIDSDLLGSEVYEYLPAGSQSVVAVKINDEYKLFRFFNFESYNNNKDEDVARYLQLYGINSAKDIAKIQFIGYSEAAKIEGRVDLISEITDLDEITEFYNFYSVIKDSSDEYFNRLFNQKTGGNVIVEPEQVIIGGEDPTTKLVPPDLPADYVEGDVSVDSVVPEESDVPVGSVEPEESGVSVGFVVPEESDVSIDSAEPIKDDVSIEYNIPVESDEPGSIGATNPSWGVDMDLPVSDSDSIVYYDYGSEGSGSTEPSSGGEGTSSSGSVGYAGNALSNSVSIRIYNNSGVYYETIYYPNFGFISRHMVSDEFADFLNDYITLRK